MYGITHMCYNRRTGMMSFSGPNMPYIEARLRSLGFIPEPSNIYTGEGIALYPKRLREPFKALVKDIWDSLPATSKEVVE